MCLGSRWGVPLRCERTLALSTGAARKLFLEDLLARPVSYFAYPHGHYDASTRSAVREAGFTSACTTAAHPVSEQSDCFALPRFQVLNWNGDEFRARVQAWQDADGHQ